MRSTESEQEIKTKWIDIRNLGPEELEGLREEIALRYLVGKKGWRHKSLPLFLSDLEMEFLKTIYVYCQGNAFATANLAGLTYPHLIVKFFRNRQKREHDS